MRSPWVIGDRTLSCFAPIRRDAHGVKISPLRCQQAGGHIAVAAINHQRKTARTTREGHRLRARGLGGGRTGSFRSALGSASPKAAANGPITSVRPPASRSARSRSETFTLCKYLAERHASAHRGRGLSKVSKRRRWPHHTQGRGPGTACPTRAEHAHRPRIRLWRRDQGKREGDQAHVTGFPDNGSGQRGRWAAWRSPRLSSAQPCCHALKLPQANCARAGHTAADRCGARPAKSVAPVGPPAAEPQIWRCDRRCSGPSETSVCRATRLNQRCPSAREHQDCARKR
jgi:hypothetical protein